MKKQRSVYNIGRNKPHVIGVHVHTPSGKPIKIQIRKNVPTGCKTPKRICILCQTTIIPKQSKRYETKVCETCFTEQEKKNDPPQTSASDPDPRSLPV